MKFLFIKLLNILLLVNYL